MKTYKFINRKTNEIYKVRIYNNLGSYTIITPDRMEHEAGSYERKQMVLANGRVSKDKQASYPVFTPYGEKPISHIETEIAALYALDAYLYKH